MRNSEFITGPAPITKEEVRAVSINKLNLTHKQSFLDVGAGTGSVSIEVALTYPQIHVTAVEHMDKATQLIQKNVDKFQLNNVTLIQRKAPIRLEEKVDAIFIGGSDGQLEEIIAWSKEMLNEGGSLVANFLLIENFYDALKLLKQYGFSQIEATLLSASKLEPLGRGEYFKPLNPIYILSCEKEKNHGK